jgi:hypothetical protein
VNEWVWSSGRVILTGESPRRKTCPNATSSTINPTWSGLVSKPDLRSCGGYEWKTSEPQKCQRAPSSIGIRYLPNSFLTRFLFAQCVSIGSAATFKLPCLLECESWWLSSSVASLYEATYRHAHANTSWRMTSHEQVRTFRRTVRGCSFCFCGNNERTPFCVPNRRCLVCFCGTVKRAQIAGSRSSWRLHFVRGRLMFVDPQYGTYFMSPFWRV